MTTLDQYEIKRSSLKIKEQLGKGAFGRYSHKSVVLLMYTHYDFKPTSCCARKGDESCGSGSCSRGASDYCCCEDAERYVTIVM